MRSDPRKIRTTPAEELEPTAQHRPTPLWLMVVLMLLLGWGVFYAGRHSGGFHPLVYAPYRSIEEVAASQPKASEIGAFDKGRRVFQTYCAICHQASGLGIPDQFPPLAGSEWVLAGGPVRLIRLVLNGGQGPMEVKGQTYAAATMPPWKDWLKDGDIAAVLTYIRQNKDWGNQASEVKPEPVEAVREKIKDRTEPFSAEELKRIPEDE